MLTAQATQNTPTIAQAPHTDRTLLTTNAELKKPTQAIANSVLMEIALSRFMPNK
jgi:hypothetical protein